MTRPDQMTFDKAPADQVRRSSAIAASKNSPRAHASPGLQRWRVAVRRVQTKADQGLRAVITAFASVGSLVGLLLFMEMMQPGGASPSTRGISDMILRFDPAQTAVLVALIAGLMIGVAALAVAWQRFKRKLIRRPRPINAWDSGS